ncbi:MAG TPA: polyhydroxybutyrate depolymerase, partial [Candidatus Bipolaricaulota bacterium]
MFVFLRRLHRLFLMVAGFALLLAGCSGWPDQAQGLQQDAGDVAGTLVFDGRARTYLLHLPPAYDGTTLLPLVIFLHGGGGNAAGAVERYGLSEEADQQGFIVVYPNGTGVLRDRVLTWNAGHCCGYALEQDV